MCLCVRMLWTGMLACKFVFTGSTLLSSSFCGECVSVCVLLHSPQGLFQLRAKNTEKLWKSFYVVLRETILRKAFHEEKKGKVFIQASTSRRALTQLPSSLPPFLHPSIPPLFLGPVSLCVDALPWAKSMSLVVVNVGHVSGNAVSQPFLTSFFGGRNCKKWKDHASSKHVQQLSLQKYRPHRHLPVNFILFSIKKIKIIIIIFLIKHPVITAHFLRWNRAATHYQADRIWWVIDEWEVDSFCRPHSSILTAASSLGSLKPDPPSHAWHIKASSLHRYLTFYLPQKFYSSPSAFPFAAPRPFR